MQVNKNLNFPNFDLRFQEVDEGLRISQGNAAYIARRWRLSDDVQAIVNHSIEAGLTCLIRHGHPRESSHLPAGVGVDYIGFSPSPAHHWVFVLNMDSRPDKTPLVSGTFDKTYEHVLAAAGVPFAPQWRSPQELTVPRSALHAAISASCPFWNSLGLRRGYREQRGQFGHFIDEEDLHASLLQAWSKTALGSNLLAPKSRVLLGGINRRHGEIDLLSSDTGGQIWVIELKNRAVSNTGGETPDLQLMRYMSDPEISAMAAGRPISGILIAQDTDLGTRRAIQNCPLPVGFLRATKDENTIHLTELARSPSLTNPVPWE